MSRKLLPAFIDISVECMKCGKVLFVGVYSRETVSKLKKFIQIEGWKHHPSEGTLCPSCIKEFEK